MPLVLDEFQEQVQHLAAYHRVQPGGGLVQHQQVGMVGQGSGQAQFHPHAPAVGGNLFPGVQPEPLQKRAEQPCIPAVPENTGHAVADAPGGEPAEKVGILKDDPQPGTDGFVCRGTAQQSDLPVVGAVHTAGDLQGGGFAGTVFSHQPHDGTGGHRQVQGGPA